MTRNTALELTVLTTMGVRAVKTYTKKDGKIDVEGYGRAKTFTAETIEVDDFGRWLRRLRGRNNCFVVLGQPKNWKKGEKKRRLSSSRDDSEATIEDVPRGWMPIDVDAIDFTPFSDIDDGEGFALELLDRLKLKGVRCVWHLTNSHGFFGKYRARLWVELAKAMTAAQMKEYAKARWGEEKVEVDGKMKAIVDLAVYQCQQPIYTGDPVLVGVDDPVTRRVGFLDGEALDAKIKAGSRRKGGKADDDNVVDDNIAKLKAAGIYIDRLKPGQHMIECPWEDEHSGEPRDDDTFYFQPHYNGHDIPAFKCHHGSCEDRKWADVLEAIDEDVPPEDDDREREPNWVFVFRLKSFWDRRDGAMIDKDAYDYVHGGASKKGKPSDLFIRSKKTQKADVVEFIPGSPRFVVKDELRVLNTYKDLRLEPDKGVDVTPWVEHVEWVVPDERDRERLLDWLAWAYQYPGKKITWAPILYSASHGVGKTTIFNVLAQCIGEKHVSEPTQAELEDKFNDWVFGKRLVKIEELMSGDKYHVAEKLKPVVSNPTISVRKMHQTGFTVRNFANVCASTNHMQALPIEKGDRRYMLIQCVEASKEVREPRMRAFHAWLEQVGHAGIAAWLAARDVSQFMPTSEAPMTALKQAVAEASKTDFDRAVDLCDVFDGWTIITTQVINEHLIEHQCPMKIQRIGLIARKRGWASLADYEGRCMVAGKKVTVFAPAGTKDDVREFVKSPPDRRDHWHTKVAGQAFDEVARSDQKVKAKEKARSNLSAVKGGKSDV